MVTLKDIAEEAHVSLMTVSNVVNGKYSKVSKEKLKEIQTSRTPLAICKALIDCSCSFIILILFITMSIVTLFISLIFKPVTSTDKTYFRQISIL